MKITLYIKSFWVACRLQKFVFFMILLSVRLSQSTIQRFFQVKLVFVKQPQLISKVQIKTLHSILILAQIILIKHSIQNCEMNRSPQTSTVSAYSQKGCIQTLQARQPTTLNQDNNFELLQISPFNQQFNYQSTCNSEAQMDENQNQLVTIKMLNDAIQKMCQQIRKEMREMKQEIKQEMRQMKQEIKSEIKQEIRQEMKQELKIFGEELTRKILIKVEEMFRQFLSSGQVRSLSRQKGIKKEEDRKTIHQLQNRLEISEIKLIVKPKVPQQIEFEFLDHYNTYKCNWQKISIPLRLVKHFFQNRELSAENYVQISKFFIQYLAEEEKYIIQNQMYETISILCLVVLQKNQKIPDDYFDQIVKEKIHSKNLIKRKEKISQIRKIFQKYQKNEKYNISNWIKIFSEIMFGEIHTNKNKQFVMILMVALFFPDFSSKPMQIVMTAILLNITDSKEEKEAIFKKAMDSFGQMFNLIVEISNKLANLARPYLYSNKKFSIE